MARISAGPAAERRQAEPHQRVVRELLAAVRHDLRTREGATSSPLPHRIRSAGQQLVVTLAPGEDVHPRPAFELISDLVPDQDIVALAAHDVVGLDVVALSRLAVPRPVADLDSDPRRDAGVVAVSMPSPPRMRSAPGPPINMSSPPPPSSRSVPSSPIRKSRSFPPNRVSSPASPPIVVGKHSRLQAENLERVVRVTKADGVVMQLAALWKRLVPALGDMDVLGDAAVRRLNDGSRVGHGDEPVVASERRSRGWPRLVCAIDEV